MTSEEQCAVEDAYGLLWRTHTDDPKVHEARKLLLSIIDKDAQKRGIQLAINKYGPSTDAEILRFAP